MKKILLSFLAFFLVIAFCAGTVKPAFADGVAPIAENLEIKTYRNTSVDGKMDAYDPENDVVSFEITTMPIKGKIIAGKDGSFVYTPFEGKRGRDYFGYKAIDSQGNLSQEATAIIHIEKQKKGVMYNDMRNRAGEYAAVVLSEKGIFTGERLGEKYFFDPDEAISCEEFLYMCSCISPQHDTVMNSDFMSEQEAAKIINDMLKLSDVDYIDFSTDTDSTSIQACINLNSVGIIDNISGKSRELSREKAAIMLVKAIEIIEKR